MSKVDLDYNKATMKDCIAKSALMHPSLLADRLAEVSAVHSSAARTTHHPDVVSIAGRMARKARHLSRLLMLGEVDVLDLDFDETVIAFGAAAPLLCLSPAVRADIASRGV